MYIAKITPYYDMFLKLCLHITLNTRASNFETIRRIVFRKGLKTRLFRQKVHKIQIIIFQEALIILV